MTGFKDRIKRFFGEDAFEWFSKHYIVDWITVAIIWAIAFYTKTITVTIRDFSPTDPLIQFEHRKNQVSSPFNQFVALLAPSAVVFAVAVLKRSLMDLHHGIVGLLVTRGLTAAIIRFMKNRIGRLRPDFMSRCQWDELLKKCTGKEKDITEGRRSFPSGHSATAWSGMFYLSLFLAGQTAAWCFSSNRLAPRLLSSRVLRFGITLVPLIWASHVGLSRMEDNRHHKEDVIVGTFIGILVATICYSMFWPNPLSTKSFAVERFGQPRYLYDTEAPSRDDRFQFELAPREDHEHSNAV
ncbi:lipid phosphate phosphatase 1 [Coprinopsis cinerea okayama7|uniref:Lipid phosphate phosphatase 1 n=1 Tax=Coprinopsis cinerea (strain Okayama-7 / 130 / ATCC MYA-4618 / FGSC 9003) TaxID=240176 RepID=A8N8Z8_COPC7|nr:lipid phosphate phosphatase 1 [Coprinopsis cinerea okayama7\|eukprot:XP_001831326.2 lipid phosphate phosphatase 1 [Coprinopsis cinerea okayama7\